MRGKRIIIDYVQDMYDNALKAMQFTSDMDFETFERNEQVQYAVVRALEIVGEAAKQIPGETQQEYPQIPWRSVTGMRNKLIHAYFGVDLFVVWRTVKEDLPTLAAQLKNMRDEMGSDV